MCVCVCDAPRGGIETKKLVCSDTYSSGKGKKSFLSQYHMLWVKKKKEKKIKEVN